MKEIMDKLDLIKIVKFYSVKDIVKKTRSHRLGENVYKRCIDKELLPKIYKELVNL